MRFVGKKLPVNPTIISVVSRHICSEINNLGIGLYVQPLCFPSGKKRLVFDAAEAVIHEVIHIIDVSTGI